MKIPRALFLVAVALPLLVLGFLAHSVAAPPPVSYQRQVRPLLEKQCAGCHAGAAPGGGFVMTTRDLLLRGGRHGAAVVPGKSANGTLVKYLTGEMQPKMPPGGAVDMESIALLRRWIDEGAKFDAARLRLAPTTAPAVRVPGAPPAATIGVTRLPAPVTCLAYAPDGKTLACGGYRAVRLLDPATGAVTRTLAGPSDQVQAMAWSSDGKFLAAAGGAAGVAGEVILFDMATGKPVRTLQEHFDVVYAVAWKPNAAELATGSLDKTVRIWDAATGKCVRVLKDHADAVFGVAYSPDGKLLATGSADRSAKLTDTTTWKRVASLSAHQDGVTRVAFNHDGTLLATAGADKTVRVWKIEPSGKMENPLRTLNEGDVINACAFSPDGSLFVYGASNRTVKVFSGDGTQQKQSFGDVSDWVYSVAVAGDNQTVAAGTQDGKVLFWDAKAGKLLRTVSLPPAASAARIAAKGVAK